MGRSDQARRNQVGVVVIPGRGESREPGIHNHRSANMDSGLAAVAAIRNDGITFSPRTRPYCRHGEKPDRDPAKHSKKDPAKPTRAKAARPDVPALDPALADCSIPASARAPRPRLADRAAAAAGQFVGPPRRFRQRAPGAQIDAAGFRRAAASRLRRPRGRRSRSGTGQGARHTTAAIRAGRSSAKPPDGGDEISDDFRTAARTASPPVAAADDARRPRQPALAGKLLREGRRGIPRARWRQ